jgi:hypothetical protein
MTDQRPEHMQTGVKHARSDECTADNRAPDGSMRVCEHRNGLNLIWRHLRTTPNKRPTALPIAQRVPTITNPAAKAADAEAVSNVEKSKSGCDVQATTDESDGFKQSGAPAELVDTAPGALQEMDTLTVSPSTRAPQEMALMRVHLRLYTLSRFLSVRPCQ